VGEQSELLSWWYSSADYFWERIQFDYTLTCTMNGRVYYIVRSHDISRRDNRRDEAGSQLLSPYSPRAIFYLLLLCASFRFLSFKCSTERVQESLSRQDAKSAKKCLSIYPNLARASPLRGNHLFSDLYLWLVFPELLKKTALVNFLKQWKIDKTLRRHFPCPRLRFSYAV